MLPILFLGCLKVPPTTPLRTEEPSPPEPIVFVPPQSFFVTSTVPNTEWLHGSFTLCTETPCGHLNQTTLNDREVYVKQSGLTSDSSPYKPNGEPSWFWAYIFEFSPENWVIQYVRPDLRDDAGNILWNAYQAGAGQNPVDAKWETIQIELAPVKTESPTSSKPPEPTQTEFAWANQTLFTQAPTIRIRKAPNVYAEILTSPTIGSTVVAIQKQEDWIEVQHEEHTGWVHAHLVSPTQPTVEKSLQAYHAAPTEDILEQRTWLERANALNPENTMVLQLLLHTLKDSKDTDVFNRVLRQYQALLSDEPIFFTNDAFTDGSLIDHLELIPSSLSCRTILKHIGLERFSENNNPQEEWSRTFAESEFWKEAQQYCTEFQKERTVWELTHQTDSGDYTWQPAILTPSLTVITNLEEPCVGDRMGSTIAELTLRPNTDSTKTPLLYVSQIEQPTSQTLRLKQIPQQEAVHIEESRIDNKTIRREYLTREDNSLSAHSVFIESEIGLLSTGEFEEKDALLSIRLGVQWHSGDETILYSEKGFGKYSYFPPTISNVTIADFQKDGGTDFLFQTGSGGYLLIETNGDAIHKTHTVEAPMPYPVGGC